MTSDVSFQLSSKFETELLLKGSFYMNYPLHLETTYLAEKSGASHARSGACHLFNIPNTIPQALPAQRRTVR